MENCNLTIPKVPIHGIQLVMKINTNVEKNKGTNYPLTLFKQSTHKNSRITCGNEMRKFLEPETSNMTRNTCHGNCLGQDL